MKTSCLLFVVGYSILFGVYYWFLNPRIESPGSWLVSFFGSLGSLLLIAGIVGLFTGSSDKAALQRAAHMQRPANGKKIAAAGIIRPTGLTLCKSPLTGEECVAYECKIRTFTDGSPVEYTSYAMSPCAISTSFGDVRLLSFPLLDAFPWEDPSTGNVFQQESEEQESEGMRASLPAAQEYIASTKFEEVKITNALQAFAEMFADEDGAVKKDLCRRLGSQEYNGEQFLHRIVRSGAEVCALGRYSAEKNALIGDMGVKTSINRLYPGSPASVSEKIGKEHRVTLGFGLVFFLFIHAFIFVVYHFRYTNASPAEQFSNLQIAIQDKNIDKLEQMLQSGVDVNLRESGGRTALLINYRDPDIVSFLIKHHADLEARDPEWDETVLFKAAREGPPEIVKMLIDAGANVNAVSKIPSRRTPLQDAIEAGRPEVEKMLADAGARDMRITAADGDPIGPNDETLRIVRAYIDAIYDKDIDTLMRIKKVNDRKSYEEGDFAFWQKIRVRNPDSVQGYKNENAATIRIEGKRPDGIVTAWWYQLSKTPAGEWIIENEWWEAH